MKKYKSHKIVEADLVKIHFSPDSETKEAANVTHLESLTQVTEENGSLIYCYENYNLDFEKLFARGLPESGECYLVQYEDGYISWSPNEVFEAGYEEIDNNIPLEDKDAIQQSSAQEIPVGIAGVLGRADRSFLEILHNVHSFERIGITPEGFLEIWQAYKLFKGRFEGINNA